jgi:hypothetical protein
MPRQLSSPSVIRLLTARPPSVMGLTEPTDNYHSVPLGPSWPGPEEYAPIPTSVYTDGT